ncbi:RagB/SusD family nutrient uptake outer membrane protein [Carboxylicivirga sp. M1479]|uniref:RagB/SusD family nutrient uptake outer membrane protein n=1 Tax=Carboxylicivirga sp. M1479 TaxID=2594476 RepID=UPI0011778AD6|nr:RagB/SusD family nutrient uptake outer membrane protein [Carboxylicivirga sp. M1479]TRX71470.1 RagB/SusD family nutrient uptake outer membrane protein [Carboxylicivirga sp. M1479]
MKNILYITLIVFLFGCSEDFIDRNPFGDLDKDQALSSYSKLESSTTGLYVYLMRTDLYGGFIPISGSCKGDDLIRNTAAETDRYSDELNMTFFPTATASGLWSESYKAITSANNVINAIDGDSFDKENAPQSSIDNLKGEALTIRALMHFNLVNFFSQHYTFNDASLEPDANAAGGHQGVPYKFDSAIEEPSRNTVKEVYDFIIKDLQDAIGLLENTKGCVYISKTTATAILARVALYKEDWALAAKMADEVIKSNRYKILNVDNYTNYWSLKKENGSESIFEINMELSDSNFPGRSESIGGIYLEYQDLGVPIGLLGLYEAGDVRRSVIKDNGADGYSIYKYPGEGGNVNVNNTKVIRFSEMYLIRAEANLQASTSIGDTPLNDINVIRQNRAASLLTSINTDIILNERQLEFAFEGLRLFDLARYAKDIDRPEIPQKPLVTYPDKSFAYPISEYEMRNNENMGQTGGY